MSGARSVSNWLAPICLGVVVLSSTIIIGAVSGYGLNLLLVTTVLAALVLPAFAVNGRGLADAIGLLVAGVIGVTGWWLVVHHGGGVACVQMLVCGAVLAALLLAEIGLCRLLVSCRANGSIAAGVVVALVGVWLLWPLWTTSAPALCVRLQPLMAINGVVAEDVGVWTEQPTAYPWIGLGQDVSYQLPGTPWGCVGVHGIGGILVLLASGWLDKSIRRRGAEM